MFEDIKENNLGEIVFHKWEEWEHFLIPNPEGEIRNTTPFGGWTK